MKILFKPIKENSYIKGFWMDSEGKLYVDNIQQVILNDSHKKELFRQGEKCIFYHDTKQAYIEDKEGNIEVLTRKKVYYLKRINKARHVKALLKKYGGFTVFYKENKLVIWEK